MHTATTTAPVAVAQLSRALTYLVYAFVVVALVSDRIAELGGAA